MVTLTDEQAPGYIPRPIAPGPSLWAGLANHRALALSESGFVRLLIIKTTSHKRPVSPLHPETRGWRSSLGAKAASLRLGVS